MLSGVTQPKPDNAFNRDAVFALADRGPAYGATLCLANSRQSCQFPISKRRAAENGPEPPEPLARTRPPHPECWNGPGVEFRCYYGLIHNLRGLKRVLVIDLDCVTDSSCDVAPVERDVCPGAKRASADGETSVRGGAAFEEVQAMAEHQR